jgi:protein-tyrosine phosphatase
LPTPPEGGGPEGLANFRDLGGLETPAGPTRHGLLMRSELPVRLTEGGLGTLRDRGLRTALDLREPVELKLDPVGFGDLAVDMRSVAIFGGRLDMSEIRPLGEFFGDMLADCGMHFAAAVRVLAAPEALPALVFCSVGKDRTGLVCGLLLSALGVPDDQVAEDFALSGPAISGALKAEMIARATRAGLDEQVVAATAGAEPELMLGVLETVRASHGGAADYLVAHGVAPEEIAGLRARLVGGAVEMPVPREPED